MDPISLSSTRPADRRGPWAALLRLWARTPVVLRAILVGELVLTLGTLPEAVLLLNLKVVPAVPWSLAASALWLWLCWRYLDGAGWPRSTAASRRRDLRGRPLSARTWLWSLLAGSLGMASVVALSFLTPRLAATPPDAFKLPVDLSSVPVWTTWSVLAGVSLFAGVVEEAAFRGYMLSQIERRHGWIVGILITGTVFFLDHHLSHAYATWAFLPFFLAVSTLHGLLVYCTRSILPSIVLHSLADFAVIPILYGIVGDFGGWLESARGFDSQSLLLAGLFLGFGAAAVPAFLHLGKVAAEATPEAKVARAL